jgi:hypothetical protein
VFFAAQASTHYGAATAPPDNPRHPTRFFLPYPNTSTHTNPLLLLPAQHSVGVTVPVPVGVPVAVTLLVGVRVGVPVVGVTVPVPVGGPVAVTLLVGVRVGV